MLRFFRKLRKDENGATAIEYGLIAGLISLAVRARRSSARVQAGSASSSS